MRRRWVLVAGFGLVLAGVAGCGQAASTGSPASDTGSPSPTAGSTPDAGSTENASGQPAADEHAATAPPDGPDAQRDEDRSDVAAADGEGEAEASGADAKCPRIDWRDEGGGSFEGSLGAAPEPSDDPGEWVIDQHGPVALAVPSTWAAAAANEAQPQVWGYDALAGDEEAGVFVTGVCGNPIIGVDGGPLDLDDPVSSGGLAAMFGPPDVVDDADGGYTALWRDVWDGLMSMRYDFVAVEEAVVAVLISQAVDPHTGLLESEHAEVMDAVVESVASPGEVECPPVATRCVDRAGG